MDWNHFPSWSNIVRTIDIYLDELLWKEDSLDNAGISNAGRLCDPDSYKVLGQR